MIFFIIITEWCTVFNTYYLNIYNLFWPPGSDSNELPVYADISDYAVEQVNKLLLKMIFCPEKFYDFLKFHFVVVDSWTLPGNFS